MLRCVLVVIVGESIRRPFLLLSQALNQLRRAG
jgi:hypothetical protein